MYCTWVVGAHPQTPLGAFSAPILLAGGEVLTHYTLPKNPTPSRRIQVLQSRRVKTSRTAGVRLYHNILWHCQFNCLQICCFMFDCSATLVVLCSRSFVVISATCWRR